MKNIYNNAYKLELPKKFVISPILNVVDMYELHKGLIDDDGGTLDEWKK